MAQEYMEEKVIITTPKGVALYPWLKEPDTGNSSFKVAPQYKTDLVLSKEDAEPLIDTINQVFQARVLFETKKQKQKEIKTVNPPYRDELDDDNQPTGNVIFRFKTKAEYKPNIYDAKGKTMVGVDVWGGSEIRVNAQVASYCTAAIGAGVTLRMRAVQVIALVQGSRDPANFDFEETTGYTHNAENTAEVFEESETVPEPKVVESIPEPVVKKETTTDSGSKNDKDISDIVAQWGTKS